MSKVEEMLRTYPGEFGFDSGELARTIDTLIECATVCTQCADACLGEDGLSPELARCIRLDLDCADVCTATARVLARQTEYVAELSRAMLEACVVACRTCAAECEGHGDHMDHCRVCAETCRRCEEACTQLLAAAR